ncbi:MAG: response regulator transcription factor [bacterium]
MSINILVAENNIDMRKQICELLRNERSFKIIAEDADGMSAVQTAKRIKPDMVLMDIAMPELSGMAATHLIKEFSEKIKIVGLTMFMEMSFVKSMFKAGASGYILKDTMVRELPVAVHKVSRNQIYFSNKIETMILSDYLKKMNTEQYNRQQYLSENDMKILQCLARGETWEEITEKTGLNCNTVEIIHQKILQTWIIFIKSLNSQGKNYL